MMEAHEKPLSPDSGKPEYPAFSPVRGEKHYGYVYKVALNFYPLTGENVSYSALAE